MFVLQWGKKKGSLGHVWIQPRCPSPIPHSSYALHHVQPCYSKLWAYCTGTYVAGIRFFDPTRRHTNLPGTVTCLAESRRDRRTACCSSGAAWRGARTRSWSAAVSGQPPPPTWRPDSAHPHPALSPSGRSHCFKIQLFFNTDPDPALTNLLKISLCNWSKFTLIVKKIKSQLRYRYRYRYHFPGIFSVFFPFWFRIRILNRPYFTSQVLVSFHGKGYDEICHLT